MDNPNDYSCLLFALQIPSICSRIEFPQTAENTGAGCDGKLYGTGGRVYDANMYKTWLNKHSNCFKDIYSSSMNTKVFCDNVYALRCQMTHEGALMSDKNKFYFVDSDNAMCVGEIVFIPIKRLCEDMYDAAYSILANNNVDASITLFNDMVLEADTYNAIYEEVRQTYHAFWSNYTEEDKMLNCIYDHIFLDNPNMKKEMDEFFFQNPNSIFEIWDFGMKYGSILDIQQKFIVQKFDRNKSYICSDYNRTSDVLCLSKEQYERMLKVVDALAKYTTEHPFDIKKYC